MRTPLTHFSGTHNSAFFILLNKRVVIFSYVVMTCHDHGHERSWPAMTSRDLIMASHDLSWLHMICYDHGHGESWPARWSWSWWRGHDHVIMTMMKTCDNLHENKRQSVLYVSYDIWWHEMFLFIFYSSQNQRVRHYI